MANLPNLFALRFLKARKSNKLLSFLSITSIIGVMLGVAALIVVISVMDGFTDNLKSKFLGSNPHIIVTKMDVSTIANWEEALQTARTVPHVKAATPVVMGQAMISNNKNITGVLVRGIDASLETENAIRESIKLGSLDDLKPSSPGELPTVLVGKELTYSVAAIPGREITVLSPQTTGGAFGIVPKMRKFKVVGYFDTGMFQHNGTLIYIDLKEAQEFFGLEDTVSALTIAVDNPDKAMDISWDLQATLNQDYDIRDPERFWARDWLSINTTLFESLKLEQYALFVILTLIIIVASFTIVSMITVTVKDKRKEIAIIRAMGGSEKLVRGIFIRQGVIIGFIGTLLGNILALILCFVLLNFKIIDIPAEIYYSDTIPIRLSLSIFIIVTLSAMAITFVAALIPARLTAKMSPIDAIRND